MDLTGYTGTTVPMPTGPCQSGDPCKSGNPNTPMVAYSPALQQPRPAAIICTYNTGMALVATRNLILLQHE